MSFSFAAARQVAAASMPPVIYPSKDEENCNGDGDDDDLMPWEDDDWVPTTSTGKQKSPNQIRNEFQKYLDTCGRTQKSVLDEIHINNNSFRKFMNPKTYKDQWSAVQNGTYWAAAKLLAKVAHEKKQQAKTNKNNKRKTATTNDATVTDSSSSNNKKAKKTAGTTTKTESRADAERWMNSVMNTELTDIDDDAHDIVVYDSCPEIVKKIKQCFIDHPNLTKASFCKVALGGVNNNALCRFLAAKKQDQQGNQVYPRAYTFFEKLRIKNNKPKSKSRLKNETEKGTYGFSTNTPRAPPKWFYAASF